MVIFHCYVSLPEGIPKRKLALMFWIYDWAERRACSLKTMVHILSVPQGGGDDKGKAMICLVDWKPKTIQWWTEGYPMKWEVGAKSFLQRLWPRMFEAQT